MMNFLLGVLAGGLIAGTATIAAARHPAVQDRLGLIPPAQAALLASARTEARCPPAAGAQAAAQGPARGVGPHDLEADQFFSRRRFWYVAPAR